MFAMKSVFFELGLFVSKSFKQKFPSPDVAKGVVWEDFCDFPHCEISLRPIYLQKFLDINICKHILCTVAALHKADIITAAAINHLVDPLSDVDQ